MLIFAVSDKGGTGRSVTACNVAYRSALQGKDVCYVDFDFGSPTSGAIFGIASVQHGTVSGGLHRYFRDGRYPDQVDVWEDGTARPHRGRPGSAGRLVLYPGDLGGSEFAVTGLASQRCTELFQRLLEEFDLTIVDLSAGRSMATQMVIEATAGPYLAGVTSRWLVFHRWTRQHIIAANGLVYGQDGILEAAQRYGHDWSVMRNSIRFVRIAVIDPSPTSAYAARLPVEQRGWLLATHQVLNKLASEKSLGQTHVLGTVPADPVLQLREQIITDTDVFTERISNRETVEAFETLASRITDVDFWSL